MCSVVAMGMNVLGGGLQAYGQIKQGKSDKAYNNYMADVAEMNADATLKAADRQVTGVQDRAAFDSGRLKDEGKRVEGAQRVALAANGVGGGSVTAEDIARDTMSKEAMDEALIRYNSDSQSDEILRGAKLEASNLRTQAKGYRLAGKMALKNAKMGAYTTLLTSASQTALMGSRTR